MFFFVFGFIVKCCLFWGEYNFLCVPCQLNPKTHKHTPLYPNTHQIGEKISGKGRTDVFSCHVDGWQCAMKQIKLDKKGWLFCLFIYVFSYLYIYIFVYLFIYSPISYLTFAFPLLLQEQAQKASPPKSPSSLPSPPTPMLSDIFFPPKQRELFAFLWLNTLPI